MVDIDGRKEPVRITYADGFDGLPVPSPDGRRLAWTSSRGGGREGQVFLAEWNHDRALAALKAAPDSAGDLARRSLTRSAPFDELYDDDHETSVRCATRSGSRHPGIACADRRTVGRQGTCRVPGVRQARRTRSRFAGRTSRRRLPRRRSSRGSARGRCLAAPTCSCRSSSPPAAATVGRASP